MYPHLTGHQIRDFATRFMVTCSIIHTFLPPWDWEPEFVTVGLSEFPVAQKVFRGFFHNRYYKLLVYLVGFIAVNLRSTIWKYISVNNPKGPNSNAPVNSETVASLVVETTQVNTNPTPGS